MAEGSDENQENPFSFKKFLDPKQKNNQQNGRVSPDVNSREGSMIPELLNGNSQRKLNSTDDGCTPKNPFSYTNFYQRAENVELPSNSGNDISTEAPSGSRHDPPLLVNPSAINSALPDFLQDHILKTSRNKPDNNVQPPGFDEYLLPNRSNDFPAPHGEYSQSRQNGGAAANLNLQKSPLDSDYSLPSYNDIDDGDNFVSAASSKTENHKHLSTPFPDFLTDDNLHSPEHRILDNLVREKHRSPANTVDLTSYSRETEAFQEDEIRQLREENRRLQAQLIRAQEEILSKDERIQQVREELKELKKKEAEDTAALEQMVQQVELNLQTTTERAVLAEATVVRLKQEVKSLQAQLKNVQKEKDGLKEELTQFEDDNNITERAMNLGSKLFVAADSAEHSLKSLLEGVEQLRLMSSLVTDIAKVQEPK